VEAVATTVQGFIEQLALIRVMNQLFTLLTTTTVMRQSKAMLVLIVELTLKH
jgi:hypothetical protein